MLVLRQEQPRTQRWEKATPGGGGLYPWGLSLFVGYTK